MTTHFIKRFLVMSLGLIILGLGIALFRIALVGNDPHTAMVMAIADKVHLDYQIVLIIVNSIWFVVEILFGRKYIGIGTFANWFGVGSFATIFIAILGDWLAPIDSRFIFRIMIMLVGIVVLSLAASMYQTSNLGIAPYDVLSLIMVEKSRLPYFWCRIITDAVCTLIAFFMGGLIGIGTLVCALGMGPFISFFDRHVSQKLCGEKEKS